ncbi:phosphoglycerate mutase family protein [Schizosaccharomyces japonicus yFS275]|uniref:Phosphoglycerate mutase family protein n=1 Tax=Schizosaccharomyces japonicus (strain yFS275 / FY16936) TaxID=402676 RepID=B6JWB1_SCHJY|nr:phosphoglycerate mutase family protein [Schizosaccharomyces japonicus yFS275]EEB05662.1 phosphoglycerate mutase family protein [Schizosaccharomyces japonicus yFS275]
MRVFLVRHGETDRNKAKILQGSFDAELNADGKQQAELVAKRLAKLDVDQVFCSTMSRCKQTIAPFVKTRPDVPIEYSDLIRERVFGELEGMPVAEAKKLLAENHPDRFGEGYSSLLKRLLKFWDEKIIPLYGQKKCVVVLCHGGVINALRDHFMQEKGFTFEKEKHEKKFITSNTGVTEIELLSKEGGHIHCFGDTSHLDEAANCAPQEQ